MITFKICESLLLHFLSTTPLYSYQLNLVYTFWLIQFDRNGHLGFFGVFFFIFLLGGGRLKPANFDIGTCIKRFFQLLKHQPNTWFSLQTHEYFKYDYEINSVVFRSTKHWLIREVWTESISYKISSKIESTMTLL